MFNQSPHYTEILSPIPLASVFFNKLYVTIYNPNTLLHTGYLSTVVHTFLLFILSTEENKTRTNLGLAPIGVLVVWTSHCRLPSKLINLACMSVQMLLPLKETPRSLSLPPCARPVVSTCILVANTTAFTTDGLTWRLRQTGPQRASALRQHAPEPLVFSDPAVHSFGELN